MRFRRLLVWTGLAVVSLSAWGGPSPLESTPIHRLPPVDVATLLAEDAARSGKDVPPRAGFPMKTDLEPTRAAKLEILENGERLWRFRVRSDGAMWLVLGFGTFRLQPGARLTVHDPGLRTIHGPYDASDQRSHGQLWVPPVPGDTAVVEVRWPHPPKDAIQPNLHLGTVLHGYRSVFGIGDPTDPIEPDSGACNVDPNCPLGANWQDEKRGVVNLLDSGGGYCSGSLITNTARDCRNYVLTANHCLSSQSSAAGTIFQFNYERPQCGSGVAPTNQQVSGAFLRATYSASDMTLLEIDEEIPEAYGAYYNGWSRSTTAPTESWCIHHPNNDEKAITYNDDPLIDGQNWGPDHWRISQWEQGTTEPGSSGSPLFDQSSRIVGQLHGGTASCSSLTYDEFGKLDVSWNGGGTAASRLRDWLDPAGTGVVAEDGIDAAACRIPQPKLGYQSHVVDDAQGNGNGVVEPGETVVLQVTAENSGTLGASAVAGTLTTTQALVAVDDGSSSWPDIPSSQSRPSNAPHFTLRLDPSFSCGDSIPLKLDFTATETPGAWTSSFSIPTGTASVATTFQDAMESGVNGWTNQTVSGTIAWTQTTADATSPTHSWFVADPTTAQEARLLMPSLAALPANSVLRFKHRYNTEANYDGGVLEYTTNGGTNWIDAAPLLTSNGYVATLNSGSALAGRSAWAGDSGGWLEVHADLDSLAGQNVQFRWRFAADASIGDEGWYVDDVVISSTSYGCAPALVRPGEAQAFTMAKEAGSFRLDWAAPASGGSPASYGLYRTTLGAPVSAQCEADLGNATTALLATLTDDRGFLVVARNAAGEGSYGSDSAGVERSPASAPCP
ncbi:MAG TPA: trypsin-like peptidase domain-containing protein [Candidatus Polarisedimenticolaceae bacterium]